MALLLLYRRQLVAPLSELRHPVPEREQQWQRQQQQRQQHWQLVPPRTPKNLSKLGNRAE